MTILKGPTLPLGVGINKWSHKQSGNNRKNVFRSPKVTVFEQLPHCRWHCLTE